MNSKPEALTESHCDACGVSLREDNGSLQLSVLNKDGRFCQDCHRKNQPKTKMLLPVLTVIFGLGLLSLLLNQVFSPADHNSPTDLQAFRSQIKQLEEGLRLLQAKQDHLLQQDADSESNTPESLPQIQNDLEVLLWRVRSLESRLKRQEVDENHSPPPPEPNNPSETVIPESQPQSLEPDSLPNFNQEKAMVRLALIKQGLEAPQEDVRQSWLQRALLDEMAFIRREALLYLRHHPHPELSDNVLKLIGKDEDPVNVVLAVETMNQWTGTDLKLSDYKYESRQTLVNHWVDLLDLDSLR